MQTLLLALTYIASPLRAAFAETTRAPNESIQCGAKALYIFAILSDHPTIAWSDLECVPTSQFGSSLLDLRKAATKCGIKTRIRAYQASEVDRLELPAIVLERNTELRANDNHYSVVYKVTSTQVYIIEPSLQYARAVARSRFVQKWTGYALELSYSFLANIRNLKPLHMLLASITISVVIVSLVSVITKHRRSASPYPYHTRHRVFVYILPLFLLLPLLTPSARESRPSGSTIWRCPGNDAINCLYCYARINGASLTYNELLDAQKALGTNANTVRSLTVLSKKFGFPLRPVQQTPDELLSTVRPVIVYVDGGVANTGAFFLLMNGDKSSVDYLFGQTATNHGMSWEEFRHTWSGIALVPEAGRRIPPAPLAVGFFLRVLIPLVASHCKRIL